RLKQTQAGLAGRLAHRRTTGDFEGHDRAVDVMIGTVDQRHFHVDHREAGEHARLDDFADTLLNARDVFLRNRPARDGITKDKTCTGLARLDNNLDPRELTRTTRLLLVGVVEFGPLGEAFAIRHLRCTDVCFHPEFPAHAIDNDVEMQFAHALDDRLAALDVGRHAEGRILLGKAVEGDAPLFLVRLGLRLDGNLDHRLGEFHPLQNNRLRRLAQRVSGRGVFQAGHGDDIAGAGFLRLFPAVGMHLKHAANALAGALYGVQRRRAGFQNARIDAHEGQRADERIAHHLEGEAGERLVIGRQALDVLLGLRIDAVRAADIDRRGHEIDNRVEQRLNTLVLERRSGQNRHEDRLDGALANAAAQRRLVRLFAFEIRFENRLIDLDCRVDHLLTVFRGLIGKLWANVAI